MSCGTLLKFEVNVKNMSSDFLKVTFSEGLAEESDSYKYRVTPFATANNEIFACSIKSSQKLTEGDDVKTVYKITFDLEGINHEFFPGDTIGVLPSNDSTLVEAILLRLNLESEADKLCELGILDGTLKKNPTIPKHLPPKSTLRNIFLHHVDIQTSPKKLFLKSLSRFAEDPHEREHLENLSSPKSNQDYSQFITTSGKTLLSLLESFPSCQPSIGSVLEHLPPLQPRPYSISSCLLSGNLEITFFVLVRDDGTKGLCTGWLENLTSREDTLVPFYFRKPSFRLDPSTPLVLVATGTGIAPFRGFFQQHRTSKVWLFYGCRYHDRDFLFREEVKEWEITRLDVACSRSGKKCYVQDKIRENDSEFKAWVLEDDARIYVCGDFKTVVRDVKKVVGDVLGLDVDEMVRSGRFVVDSWV